MNNDPIQPENPLDDDLPPGLLEALRTFPSEQGRPSRESDDAIITEARTTLSAIHRRRIHTYFWPVLATAACMALAFSLWSRPKAPPVSSNPPPAAEDKYALILREVTSVFPDQVKAIIADGGELRIALADQPLATKQQPVVVELCENLKCTTVITYVGQTVEVGGHIVTIRSDEKGAIVVDTSDAQEAEDPTHKSETGLQIRTRSI